MRVILFGGSGMVGQGVLRECLLDTQVKAVLSVGRSPSGRSDPKLREVVRSDLFDLAPIEEDLRGWDACFFCLGVSSVGMPEAAYRRVTYDLTVSVAATVARLNPGLTFTYVSGAGTDSSEHGRSMWARVKGQTENALLRIPFKAAYMFRPGFIRPRHGTRLRSRGFRALNAIFSPFVVILTAISPDAITTTEMIGRAMIHVAERGAPKALLGARDIRELAK
jgi:uncharacterized protein YbjT (DUF2867 family)